LARVSGPFAFSFERHRLIAAFHQSHPLEFAPKVGERRNEYRLVATVEEVVRKELSASLQAARRQK